MKKIPAKIVLTLLLCLAMLPFQASTYADGGLRNEIKGDNGSNTYSSDGRDLFYTAANAFKVEPPQSSDYFTQPFSRYISAPMGHSMSAVSHCWMSCAAAAARDLHPRPRCGRTEYRCRPSAALFREI